MNRASYKSLTLYAGEAARYVGSDALICSNEARKNGEGESGIKRKEGKKSNNLLVDLESIFLFNSFFFPSPIAPSPIPITLPQNGRVACS